MKVSLIHSALSHLSMNRNLDLPPKLRIPRLWNAQGHPRKGAGDNSEVFSLVCTHRELTRYSFLRKEQRQWSVQYGYDNHGTKREGRQSTSS